jgi:hypothetical protein
MDPSEILAAIDAELERLRQVRELLQGSEEAKSGAKKKSAPSAKPIYRVAKRRVMSAEERHRISAAMKKRWALVKKGKAKGGGGTGDGGYGFTSKGDK